MNMFRAIKLCSIIFVACIVALPYLPLLSHVVSHSLYAFEHHHAHGGQAAVKHVCEQEQDRDHSHDHDIAVDTYPIARLASLVKVKFPDSPSLFNFILPATILVDRPQIFVRDTNTAPRLRIENFITLSLYPANAPPIR